MGKTSLDSTDSIDSVGDTRLKILTTESAGMHRLLNHQTHMV
jgi:hypothetical protein